MSFLSMRDKVEQKMDSDPIYKQHRDRRVQKLRRIYSTPTLQRWSRFMFWATIVITALLALGEAAIYLRGQTDAARCLHNLSHSTLWSWGTLGGVCAVLCCGRLLQLRRHPEPRPASITGDDHPEAVQPLSIRADRPREYHIYLIALACGLALLLSARLLIP